MKNLSELSPLVMKPVTRLELIKYAGASGDYNPIHTIDEEAKEAGLKGVIAHGMLTMAKVSRLISPFLEQGFIKSFSTRFTGMVYVDDVITITPELVKVVDSEYYYQISAVNQKGETVVKSKIIFQLFK
ncbi:MaoC/PaaZ C-terminal domain-containing protein [Oceanobacillus halophilus]|uniref:Dehydratase n=1 Tax=Oceanobacillus halophilus TaxID=930130 RepID=A0A495A908_9BACI|nr:MaoC/PaaZ C-terminal domain-containing protein [Oceanobacillus halophilus]RKQ35775.1 dehydratase [Oceanobacillus halophilus]